jgi:hypothetical protein
VTAHIAGAAGQVGGRTVGFVVTGQNSGATGTCSPTPDCKTDAAGNVAFTYSVPVAPSSLGTDTITVSTVIAGNSTSVTAIKHWVDTTPPVASCPPGPNPGSRIPRANNQDGFFRLVATDDVDPNVQIFVEDSGTGTTWGGFPNQTTMKYTEANGATPSIRPGAGSVDWQIRGQCDAIVNAVDGSGNQSAPVFCLVPPPPL